jgi:hypothetical protein
MAEVIGWMPEVASDAMYAKEREKRPMLFESVFEK